MSKIKIAFEKELGKNSIVDTICKHIPDTKRAIMLFSNIKQNQDLRQKLMSGKIDPIFFATKMTHQDIKPIIKPIEVSVPLYERPDSETCENCNSKKTECTQHHNIDVSIVHVYCFNCKHRFKIT